MDSLIKHLTATGVLYTQRIIDAFRAVDRIDFVLPGYEEYAYEDQPLPIDSEQTISQPTTVAIMLELLEPQLGDKILDVGSGSGWTTALLAHIVGEKGHIYGVERIAELVDFGQENLQKYPYEYASIEETVDTLGLPELAPYDRILVSAANDEIPKELIEQLVIGGVMVIPIEEDVVRVVRESDTKITTDRMEGFAFVPLISPTR